MELEFSGHDFEKSSKDKFNDTPSSGSHVVPCGQTDMTNFDVCTVHLVQFIIQTKIPEVGEARMCNIYKDMKLNLLKMNATVWYIKICKADCTAHSLLETVFYHQL